MRLRFEPRLGRSKWRSFSLPILAIALTLAISMLIFWLYGEPPIETARVLFVDPFFDRYNLPEVFLKATPLMLIAYGLSVGFRANIWNIGAEGQFIMGAIGAAAVAMSVYPGGGVFLLPMMIIVAMMCGALYALIVAVLRVRFQTSEILVSLMLVYIAQQILELLMRGALKDPEGLSFPKTRSFQADALLPIIWDGTRVHIGVAFAILLSIVIMIFMARHRLGLDVRVSGLAPKAARYAGADDKKIIYFVFALTGALAGLAGAFEVAGPVGGLDPNTPAGYGFTAIIVAFLGRLNPIGIVLAAILIAATTVGGSHFSFGMPPDTVLVVQGIMLFCLLGVEIFDNYRLKLGA